MGLFTSNLSGQPNLYPTKKDYEGERKVQESELETKQKQPKLYPTKGQYSSSSLEETNSNSMSQSSFKPDQRARQILMKLKIHHLLLADLLQTLQGDYMICSSMNRELQICVRSVGKFKDLKQVEQVCKNQLESYRLCLEKVIQNEKTVV